jgi:protein subunit release factor A
MTIPEEDLEIRVHSAKPEFGMHHNGIYPTVVQVIHIPTQTSVAIGTEDTLMKNKAAALMWLEEILDDL